MTPELAGKLLKICKPYRPNMDHAACPGHLCVSSELLKVNNINPADFSSIPPTIYDGINSEVRTSAGEVTDRREVHVFMKHGLEKLTNGKATQYER